MHASDDHFDGWTAYCYLFPASAINKIFSECSTMHLADYKKISDFRHHTEHASQYPTAVQLCCNYLATTTVIKSTIVLNQYYNLQHNDGYKHGSDGQCY